ncbi:glutamate--cysteine ligase, partial [Streptococcus suis]
LYYLENLHYLSQIIRDAGLEVKIGWFGDLPEGMSGPVFKLQSQTQKEIEYSETRTVDGTLRAGDWVPDLVILNNDFSGGYPTALDEVKQPIVPSHE